MIRTNPRSRRASLRTLPRETRSVDLVTLTSPLAPTMQAVGTVVVGLYRGARMTTIGANLVCRLQECSASPTTTRRSLSNCCQRVDVSPPRQEGPCLRRTWGAHAPTRCAWVRAPSYRLRFKTPDALSLVSRTIWLDPCTIMSITPEIEYSLL
jgi:hypothetical protein